MAIAPISLGNSFTNAGGTTVLNGVSSGLDINSIINTLVSAQTAQVTKLQDQITVNNNQASALSNLQQLLAQIQSDVSVLSSPQNPDSTTNVFAARTSQVTSNTTQAASNFLTASVGTSAPTGTYTISNISQLAQATIQESNGFSIANANTAVVTASPTSGMFTAGTFTLNGKNITLTANETLNQVVSAINTADTGITASALQTAPGVYKLVLTGASTGAANNFDLNAFQTNAVSVASASAATNGEFTAGDYTVNGQTVSITADESLNDIADAFNTAGAGVTATVVQISTGSYKIVFTGDTADLSNNAAAFDLATSNNITSGASALSNVLFTTDQVAQDALFTFNGVAIDRASNTVSDLATGVTFNLLQDTNSQPGASLTVAVTPDTTTIANAIQKFATDYNAFLDFYAKQTQFDTDTGQPDTNATLYSDTTLRAIFNQLSNYAASVVSGLPSGQSTLTDIGINFANAPATSTDPEVDNALSIDGTTLLNALNNNLSEVENIFGYNATSSSENLGVYQQPNDPSISSFTVNVDQTGQVYTVQYTDSQGHPQTVNMTASALGDSSIALTAPNDSGLAGLVLIYTGGGNESGISVTSTNGIASLMNTFITSAITPSTGSIAVDQQAIATKTSTTQTQITNVNTQITTQRNMLLQKFSELEAAIASANSSLNYLNAQQAAYSAGNG